MNGKLNDYDVAENLRAAGCDTGTIEKFMDLGDAGKRGQQIELLNRHRRGLVERLHEEGRKIDCLDYLLNKMEKSK